MADEREQDDMAARVVAAYQDGVKISAIEREFNVPPATIYYILEQAGVAPDRMRRADRLVTSVSPEMVKDAPRYSHLLGGGNEDK